MWVTTHFAEIVNQPDFQKSVKTQRMYGNFFTNLSSIISEKMRGYPQFSFWVLIALAKICFFHIVLNGLKPRKNIVVLVGKFLKIPEYPEMHRTCAE